MKLHIVIIIVLYAITNAQAQNTCDSPKIINRISISPGDDYSVLITPDIPFLISGYADSVKYEIYSNRTFSIDIYLDGTLVETGRCKLVSECLVEYEWSFAHEFQIVIRVGKVEANVWIHGSHEGCILRYIFLTISFVSLFGYSCLALFLCVFCLSLFTHEKE
jgi:hypothetical protein